MDYDDQMVYALRNLRQYPAILRDFQARYRYFCVDEAQDTSKIQHTIIRLLAGQSGNLFMVGDEDQSIYGFRAAYSQALTEFDAVYPSAKVPVYGAELPLHPANRRGSGSVHSEKPKPPS